MTPRSPQAEARPAEDPRPFRWLFLDFNSYFASVEQETRPELRGRPVIVVPVMTDTTCCIAASYEAKAFGIRTGMLVGEARSRCPHAVLVDARHELYLEYHNALVEAVESCLHVDVVMSIDEMACRLLGREQEPEPAVALAMLVKKTIRERIGSTLRCSVGLAPNRFLAKVASDMQKPDGLVMIQACELPQILYSLKPQDFPGIGPRMNQRLAHCGITTVEQLCRLNATEMRDVWGGVVGERFYHGLRGEDLEMEATDRHSVSHSHVLPPESRSLPEARAVAQKLLCKAAERLREMNYWTPRLSLFIRFLGEQEDWTAHKKLPPCHDTLTLLEALHAVWQKAPQGKPLAVGVALSDLIPDELHAGGLFEPAGRAGVDQAMDKMNDKYGSNTIYFGGVHGARKSAPTRIAFGNIPGEKDFK